MADSICNLVLENGPTVLQVVLLGSWYAGSVWMLFSNEDLGHAAAIR